MCRTTTTPSKKAKPGPAGGQFPGKLHDLMTYIEGQGWDHVISWVQDGQAIMVHDPERLLDILPLFGFGQTKYRSFQRQLNMWHWQRILRGPYKGAWSHPYFVRGNKLLCTYMSRTQRRNPSIPAEVLASCMAPSTPTQPVHKKLSSDLDYSFELPSKSFELPSSLTLLDKSLFEDDFSPLPVQSERFSLEKTFPFLTSIDPTPILEQCEEIISQPIEPNTGNMQTLLDPLPADAFESLF